MLQRVRSNAVVGVLIVLALGASTVGAAVASSPTESQAEGRLQVDPKRAVARPVLKVSPKQVDEGDRVTLTAKVRSPRKATRATLQKFRLTVFGDVAWDSVKSVKVRGRKKIAFKRVATGENSERYRVIVAYRKPTKVVVSKPVAVTIWRWIPLSEYHPYYEVGGPIFGTATINGRAYKGWGSAYWTHVGSWEGRFTPGRRCKSFKAVAGLGDVSDDGSTGSIAFTADDTTVYTSPVLTPGMSVPVTVALAKPYRFGILLSDTTPGGTTGHDEVESWPFLGEPAFLCTGV